MPRAEQSKRRSLRNGPLSRSPAASKELRRATMRDARQEDTVFGIESEWIKAPEDVTSLALFVATQPDRGPTAQSFSLMRRDN